MERKIGEIFKYNGEWYQCVKDTTDEDCGECDFHCYSKCEVCGFCSSDFREDKQSVCFKKLETVGEPYSYTSTTDKIYNVLMQQYKVYYDEILPLVIGHFFILNPQTNTIAIELKQNKEDMEEKKLNLKPFDIQKAREGKPVCTRDGRKVRIICFDKKYIRPIVALVDHGDEVDEEVEEIIECHNDGYYNCREIPSPNDLMMLPEKKEGWVNINKATLGNDTVVFGHIFKNREDAVKSAENNDRYIATVKIEWEG